MHIYLITLSINKSIIIFSDYSLQISSIPYLTTYSTLQGKRIFVNYFSSDLDILKKQPFL